MTNPRATHESYGFIRASRVSGRAALFDSAINHQHFVSVTIGRCGQERLLSRTWRFPTEELMTVDMSEHQFAELITSMNTGSGSACTIRRFDGHALAPPPPDLNTRQSFEPEIRAETEKVAKLLSEGVAKLETLHAKGKATKGELHAALKAITSIQSQLTSTLPFILKQFAEHMEELTARAKSDVTAHAVAVGLGVERADVLRIGEGNDA